MTDAHGRRRLAAAAAMASIIGLSACSTPISEATMPEVSLAGLSFADAGPAGQAFTIQLRLKNTNEFDIPVERLDFDLDVAGQPFATGRSEEDFTLPASAEIVVPIAISIETDDLIRRVTAIGTGKRLDYQLSGAAVIDAWFRDPVMSFDREGKLALPFIPAFLEGGERTG